MRKYDYSVSFIRMIGMMMVIACHVFQQISPIMGRFSDTSQRIGDYCANGVQIFLLVSGYLYAQKEEYFIKAKSRIGFVIRNFKKILIEYWCYCILVIFPVYAFLEPESIGGSTVLAVLTTAKTVWGVHHLWFIPYILVCYLITPVLFDLKMYLTKSNKKIFIPGFALLIFLIEWLSYWFESYFVAEWICVYCIGFFIPELIKEIKYRGGGIHPSQYVYV